MASLAWVRVQPESDSLAAVALRADAAVLSADHDSARMARVIPLELA